MADRRENHDPRLMPLDITMPPLQVETVEIVESAAAQVHTVIVTGVYGPEEVELETGSVRR